MKRVPIEETIESQITTALIISTEFNAQIEPLLNFDFFQSPHLKRISSWCIDYYRKYNKAPEMIIQSIYEIEQDKLDPNESELIRTVLLKLSSKYAKGDTINEAYIYDNALKYFDERELSLRLDKASKLRDVGRITDAWNVINEKTMLSKAVSGWEDVLTLPDIISTYDRKNKGIFGFPGILGEMIGDFERGWLVGILGGFKRGKTNTMLDLAVRALMKRLKVAIVSLEMPAFAVKDRIYRNIAGVGTEEQYCYPVFDCMSNQMGTCSRSERSNTTTIRARETDSSKVLYDSNLNTDYHPCTFCRENDPTLFIPTVWYERIESPVISTNSVYEQVEAFTLMYGDNLKVISKPRFSASIDDVRRDLDVLEHLHGFIPDVIIDDYANIHKATNKTTSKEPRHIIDDVWKNLGGLAAEREAVVVSGNQGTRASLKKALQEEEDIAEWIGILGHVDVYIALNQLPVEKKQGMIRYNLLAHRYKKFYPDQDVIVLQQLDTGQAILDSAYAHHEE